MGYMFMIATCCNCRRVVLCNPDLCPSIRIDGQREPLCQNCFNEWNEIHRLSKGLEPIELNPGAYAPAECN